MKTLALMIALALAACASAPAVRAQPRPETVVVPPPCALSHDDAVWVDRALEAWRFARREIADIAIPQDFRAVFFDGQCAITSPNALSTDSARDVTWAGATHGETVTLPDGQEIPAGVISFTSAENGRAFFVMSTPSVWRAGSIPPGPMGLDTLMVAVMLHEASHVAQSATYGARITALQAQYGLPDSFNDDSMQHEFESNTEFSTSVERETDLFFRAAAATDDAEALRLARQARAMMKARAARWFSGGRVYYVAAEDLWLTFEGSGQWLGYKWLINPRGGAISTTTALPAFGTRSRWWSQHEGLAVALTLDRLGARNWPRHAFGDGAQTLLQMLDAALA